MTTSRIVIFIFNMIILQSFGSSQTLRDHDTLTCIFKKYNDFTKKDDLLVNSYLVGDSLFFYRTKAAKKALTFNQAWDMEHPVMIGNPYCIFVTKDKKIIAEGYWTFETFYGLVKEYFPNGNLKSEGVYVSGAKDEVWKYYNELGVKITEELYNNGTLISTKSF